MRAHLLRLSLLLLGLLAISGVACGSASVKPGGGAGASGRAGAGGSGGAGGSAVATGAGGAGGGAASPACVLDSTQIDNCTLE